MRISSGVMERMVAMDTSFFSPPDILKICLSLRWVMPVSFSAVITL